MTRLLLIRHGVTTWNAEGRWQGWFDAPLSDTGRAQAEAAVAALAGAGFDCVVTSDLGRARETAEIIAAALGGVSVEVDADLRERDVGHWSGLTSEEIEAQWPGQLDRWRAGALETIPGGEGDISGRVVAAVERILVSHPGRTVLGVTHGGVIRTVERHLGLSPKGVGNLAGRWIEASGSPPVAAAGEAVNLIATNAPLPRTTVL